MLILVLAGALSTVVSEASADLKFGDIKVEKPKGTLTKNAAGEPVWVETIRMTNNGNMDGSITVTSQPYNRKNNSDDPTKPIDKTVRQEQTLDIKQGQTITVTFTYSGAEAKEWSQYYVDVYKPDTSKEVKNLLGGAGVGSYGLIPIAPGAGGTAIASFEFAYPQSVEGSQFGAANFSLVVDGVSLSSGWTFDSLEPSLFTIDEAISRIILAAFTTDGQLSSGERGFVDFRLVLNDEVAIYFATSQLGVIVVDEPATMTLVGAVAVVVMIAAAARAGRRTI